ncbi:fimbrillin family protein [Bacteroides gallinarum]|uniref:fimbrillin family protein n=1 Tax=Bacteroides gallinarum TaxID=376806 RepID=UPI0003676BE3|nr:fimbrillin family protein [Bacteroides gallinarum]
MNKNILSGMIFGAALLLLAACTQDELTEQGDTLPEGVYPLEISSVTLDAEVSSQPWRADGPQTRVSENTGENSSKWDGGDIFYAKPNGASEAGKFQIQEGGIAVLTPTYWTQTTDDVTAWHASPETESGTIDLSDQTGGLAYLLQAIVYKAPYDNPVSLKFSHQLSKIRVKLEGDKANDVSKVSIESYTTCVHTNGTMNSSENNDEIRMYRVDNTNIYEANVVPGKKIEKFKVNNGDWVKLSNPVTPVAGSYHEITITVNLQTTDIDLSSGNATISEDGNYRITGNNSGKGLEINIPGSDWGTVLRSTIVLDNTTLESINMAETGYAGAAYVTFIIKGDVTVSKGIIAKCGGEIRIEGTAGSKLTITSPDGHNPAIGNLNTKSAGVALFIEDATIEATGSGSAAVIGTSSGWPGSGSVGDITIKNSTLTLTAVSGDCGNPAVIGTGATDSGSLSCGNINIYLKEGQSKTDFLQNLKGSYNQQVGVGNASGGSVSCGSINWYNFDESPAN